MNTLNYYRDKEYPLILEAPKGKKLACDNCAKQFKTLKRATLNTNSMTKYIYLCEDCYNC